jgi:hypothetical protein
MIMERGRALAIGSPADLARAVVAARMVDIEVPGEQHAAALQALRDASFADAAPGRHGLTFRVESREAIPVAVAVLSGAHVPIYRVTEREPDLEAAYFALHGGSGDRSAAE